MKVFNESIQASIIQCLLLSLFLSLITIKVRTKDIYYEDTIEIKKKYVTHYHSMRGHVKFPCDKHYKYF